MSEITIRTARLDDASKLVSIYRYYVEKTAITFEYEVPTVAAVSYTHLTLPTT